MGKLLFWIVLIGVAWMALRLLTDKARQARDVPPPRGEDGVDGKQAEAMRQCAYCGTFVPASEIAVSADGREYCGRDHLEAASNASTK